MIATHLRLPRADRTLAPYVPSLAPRYAVTPQAPPRTRVAYAAAHVVADPLAALDPAAGGAIDWEATLAYRRHLWSLGFAVAEAMDTAQRGMGLSYADAQELIRRSAAEARAVGGLVACGAGTDQLEPGAAHGLAAIERAYLEQCAFVEEQGCAAIVMASRALARSARSSDDYARVYERVLGALKRPAILHWLGPMFDPQLAGYWGSADLDRATDSFVEIVRANAAHVDGVKLSLLDAAREIDVRCRLPASVRVYTGDDFNYPELIAGDTTHFSHALLGIFDAIAPAARAAFAALDDGDRARVRRDPRADGTALAASVRRANLRLQDRDRVPGLPQRLPGPLPDGGRRRERAFRGAPRHGVRAGRCGGLDRRPGTCRRARGPRLRDGRDRLAARSSGIV